VSSDTELFVLEELIDLVNANSLAKELKTEIAKARRTIDSKLISMTAWGQLAQNEDAESLPERVCKKVPGELPLYGIKFNSHENEILALITQEKISKLWQTAADSFMDDTVFCRIYDDTGKFVAGETPVYIGREVIPSQQFSIHNPSGFFSEWKIMFYFHDGVFGQAAQRQRIVYFWTAALVIGFMVLVCGFAVKSLLRQAAVNRLKNDFVATVTHELKTPLASMRVLVDTLLEGNYNDQQQAKEYLQLISKENKRLTGLIDNFLTFSRMERNKQAFDMVRTCPKAIAEAAVDAVSTKFNSRSCQFTVTIDDNLPPVIADKDAMVTVLVNLLDNAYKYSNDDKIIMLNVFGKGGYVCFSVADNGIAMTPRQAKKAFDRFYQADNSLARRTEGTGLGLSIVKFIVDAHKGRVEVESKQGKGTTFTVKLTPVA
jgi:signal transduction histidine kinase